MAQKISRSKRKECGITLKKAEGFWINYQLYSVGLTHAEIARRAGVSGSLVTAFIRCRKNSERTKAVLVSALGYKDWDSLHAAAKRGARAGTAA
jgi:hypothetical protein